MVVQERLYKGRSVGRPKDEETKLITVYLPKDTVEKIDFLCQEQSLSRSKVVEFLVKLHIDEELKAAFERLALKLGVETPPQ